MIEHALGYIHEHYMEPLNLKTLAGLYEMDVKNSLTHSANTLVFFPSIILSSTA
ncbi:hypothetical protein HMSSN036_69970 [Paenibacillus macerans]|nr:hypothetical protein HMSSN036_69970 [Paenibacillus macerans]